MKRQIRYPLIAAAIFLWAMLLLWAARAWGQTPCVSIDYRLQVPASLDPNGTDLNSLILPPALLNGGPVWEAPSGKFNRTGPCCDAEGDPFVITVISSPTPANVTLSADKKTWTLVCDLLPGLNLIVVQATDLPPYGPPASRTYTILANGLPRPNTAPVLY
mgnify:CR=1 FL=1